MKKRCADIPIDPEAEVRLLAIAEIAERPAAHPLAFGIPRSRLARIAAIARSKPAEGEG